MKNRATATLQTEPSEEHEKNFVTRSLCWTYDRIDFIFTGLAICLFLTLLGIFFGTIVAIFAATILWAAFLSIRKVAITHTLIWLLLINVALVSIGRAYDDLNWFEITVFVALSPIIYLMSWGAGIRLCINHSRRKT